MRVDEVDTPSLLIDLDRMERNIDRLQHYMDAHGIHNRPHVKTHKIPAIAHKQLDAGAIGISCQKLGEAQVMADAGIKDITVTYNIIGQPKLERMIRLAKQTKLTLVTDNLLTARGISEAACDFGLTIDMLVELGTEAERTGVTTVDELVKLAMQMSALPGLRLRGMMLYPSSVHNADRVTEVVSRFERSGLCTDVVSGGGTPPALDAHKIPEITEHRAGTYLYNDRQMIDKGVATPDDCALTILTTVVSRPTEYRAILDGGSKAFSSDGGFPMGYVFDYPEAVIYSMHEEHGFVDLSACEKKPRIGERVRVVPNHACGASNMHNVAYGFRGDEIETVWDILARGRLR